MFYFGPAWMKHHFIPSRQCFKCGLFHHKFELCHATGQKCFKCGKTGHFARVCCSNLASRHAIKMSAVTAHTTGNKKTRTKSVRKQERDSQRYCAYKESKKLLCLLPFSSISNSSLLTTLSESSGNIVKDQLKTTEKKMFQLQGQLNEMLKELKQKDSELSIYLEMHNSKSEQNYELKVRIKDIESANKELCENMTKSCIGYENRISHLNEYICELQSENEVLQKQLSETFANQQNFNSDHRKRSMQRQGPNHREYQRGHGHNHRKYQRGHNKLA